MTGWLDHWADRAPDRRAFSDGIRELTYEELRLQAHAFARHLRAHGVKDGDRVAVQLPNWVELAAAYAGIARACARAVIVPIMTIYRHDEVRHVLRNSGARLVVTADTHRGFDHRGMFRELMGDTAIESLVVVRSDHAPCISA